MANIKWLGGYTGDVNNVNQTGNYSGSVLPVNSDNLYVEANPTGTDYGMTVNPTALSAVTLSSLNVSQTYTGAVGNSTNAFTVGATIVNIGYQNGGSQPGVGSSFLSLNQGSTITTWNIYASAANSTMSNGGPIALQGSHTSNTLNLVAGIVSVAIDPPQTAAIRTINSSGQLTLGQGVTTNSVNIYGGLTRIICGAVTATLSTGSMITSGTGSIATMAINSGSAKLNSSGSINSLSVATGTADFSGDPRPKTVAAATVYNGGILNLNNGVKNSITLTTGIATVASPGQFQIIGWPNSTFTLS